MYAITTSSGKSFGARLDESLLDAALRQQVVLGYSCRTGRCSSCKGFVLTGETTAVRDELGLSADERAQGYILTCVRRASGPVHLQIDDLGDVALPEAKTLPCRIHTIDKLAPDVLRVVLRLPPASPLRFLPGQYIDVIGAAGLRRSYSLANAPRADGLLELHVREVADGAMSRYWFHEAKSNDLLRLRGPLGTFFLRRAPGKHLVFLATGTGIAPVKSIIESLPGLGPEISPLSVTVVWGGRLVEDLYWQPPSELAFVRWVPVLSRADARWPGARGHVQNTLLAERPDLANTLVYACGSDAMIHSASAQLQSAGLPAVQFHSDAFVCSADH